MPKLSLDKIAPRRAPADKARKPSGPVAPSPLAQGIGRGVGRPKRDTLPYSFRLPPDLHRRFAVIVRGMEHPEGANRVLTMSDVVQGWIEKFVDEQEAEAAKARG